MKELFSLFVLIVSSVFIGCTGQNEPKTVETKKNNVVDDSGYSNWKTVTKKNIQFSYPKEWRLKIYENPSSSAFFLTFDSDTTTVFFPVELFEFPKDRSYKDFSNSVTYRYFLKQTDGKNGELMSREPSKFKNFQADKFEYIKNGNNVEIFTVNGLSRYFLFARFLAPEKNNLRINKIEEKIINSIDIFK
jgi:hypothetical protein